MSVRIRSLIHEGWRGSLVGLMAALSGGVLMAACGGAPPEPAGPTVDADQVAAVATAASPLTRPTRIYFDWSVVERDARVRGTGIARIEPPDRARLDLYRTNLEQFSLAVVIGDDLRMPSGVNENVIPPANLLWGTLGVFRPGAGALVGGQDRGSDGTMLRYLFPGDEEVRYDLAGGTVMKVERMRGDDVVQDVVLRYVDGDGGYPSEAVYRDLAEFVELTITRTSVEYVDPYPPDIWELRR